MERGAARGCRSGRDTSVVGHNQLYRTYETISAPHDVDWTQPNDKDSVQSKWLHQIKEHLIAFRAGEKNQGRIDKYCRRTGGLSRKLQLLLCRTTFWDKCESCAFGFPWCARGMFHEWAQQTSGRH